MNVVIITLLGVDADHHYIITWSDSACWQEQGVLIGWGTPIN